MLIAGVALLVALAAVGLIIWRVAQVIPATTVSIYGAARDESGSEGAKLQEDVCLAKENDFLALEYATVAELKEKYEGVKTGLRDHAGKSQGDLEKLEQDYSDLTEQVMPMLFSGVAYYRIQRLFRRAITTMLCGGLVVAAGIVSFAWATNPPPEAEAPEFRTPVNASVHLTGPDQQRLGETLGEKCVRTPIQAIVLSVSNDTFDLVSVPTEECKLARFDASNKRPGTVQPVESIELSPGKQ